MALSAAQRSQFEKVRRAGSGAQGVGLNDDACRAVIIETAADLGVLDALFPDVEPLAQPFFECEPDDFKIRLPDAPYAMFEKLVEQGPPDVDTYFSCLASLHKARLKYQRILETQPVPTVDQVGPRGLLQYGSVTTPALTALLFVRKWMFDIDNRAGQETGYLFEPIIAAAIGGVPMSAKKSPVKRRNAKGGRQVDCLRGDDAYELKLRVTIAASGQGRWGEELDFPEDAKASGFRPILVVFDPTPNPKLAALQRAFREADGECYVGPQAWEHLDEAAGATLAEFIERYIRQPLQDVLESAPSGSEIPEVSIHLREDRAVFVIGQESLEIERIALLDDEGDDLREPDLPDDVAEALPGLDVD